MLHETIVKLHSILNSHISTLYKISYDKAHNIHLSESSLQAVNFDKIPREYARSVGCSSLPASNDALYISPHGEWYFIEFKNGSIDKSNLYRKIYDSLIMLLEIDIIPSMKFAREKINYILVYNPNRYRKTQDSKSRDENIVYLLRLAKQEEKLFGIADFEHYLFFETHTYTPQLFHNQFVAPMETLEQQEKADS